MLLWMNRNGGPWLDYCSVRKMDVLWISLEVYVGVGVGRLCLCRSSSFDALRRSGHPPYKLEKRRERGEEGSQTFFKKRRGKRREK